MVKVIKKDGDYSNYEIIFSMIVFHSPLTARLLRAEFLSNTEKVHASNNIQQEVFLRFGEPTSPSARSCLASSAKSSDNVGFFSDSCTILATTLPNSGGYAEESFNMLVLPFTCEPL